MPNQERGSESLLPGYYSCRFPKSASKFTGNVILKSFWSTQPYPSHSSRLKLSLTSPAPHSHTPADTRPPRGEAAAALAPSSPWSARISPVRHQSKCHKAASRAEEGGPPGLRDARAAHRGRLQLHKALFGSPLRGHQAAPGEEWGGGVSV